MTSRTPPSATPPPDPPRSTTPPSGDSRTDRLDDALAWERAYHDRCRAALAAMVDGSQEQVIIGENASASGADAEVLGYPLRSRAREFEDLPEAPMFFGRLDFVPEAEPGPEPEPPPENPRLAAPPEPRTQPDRRVGGAGEHAGQSYHIGRLRITRHPAAPPLVVDWRAPRAPARPPSDCTGPRTCSTPTRSGSTVPACW